jgi:ABC-2 type transport system permease protein
MKWGMSDMTRSRYYFNSSIIRQNFRQHGWIGIIYALGLLFALPLQLFMSNNPNEKPQEIEHLFRIAGSVQALFIITIPVAAGLFLFRYLQAKSPSDLFHSLPLRREHLFTAHLTSGLILLLLPVWLTAGVVAVVKPWSGNFYIFQGADIWQWCITVSILTLFLFCFSVFVGICTGQSILQGIIVYILLILPAVLISLGNSHLGMYLYGYANANVRFLDSKSQMWSPFVHIMYYFTGKPYTNTELWIYGVLSLLFIGLSYLLYRKRNTEKAGQAIAFGYFNPLFKAGVMLCAMLISGTYFAQMKQQQIGWVIGGYAIGAIIGYIAAEMIIRKTWQIMTRKVLAEFSVYTVMLGLLLYIPVSSVTGYEARVPSGERISGVYMGSNYRWYTPIDDYSTTPYMGQDPFSHDKDYIEAVRKFHQAVVAVRPEHTSQQYVYEYFTLAYQLENGHKLVREYWIPNKGFESEIKAVKDTEAFKYENYNLTLLDKDLDYMWITNRNKKVAISDPGEISELKEIIKHEILNMSYEVQVDKDGRPDVANIQTQIKVKEVSDRPSVNYGYYYPWKSSFHELDKWMVEKGYTDKVRTTVEDIQSAEIIKDDYMDKQTPKNPTSPEQRLILAREKNRTIVTKDKALLTDIVDNQFNYGVENGNYIVKLMYKEGYSDFVMLKASDMTPELKVLLK